MVLKGAVLNLTIAFVNMESSIYNGFQHHFPNLGRLLRVRHLGKRDDSKLVKLLAKNNLNASQR